MSPDEPQLEAAGRVNMSPEAILQRLQLVGQLNELCRFLQTGQRLVRQNELSQHRPKPGLGAKPSA